MPFKNTSPYLEECIDSLLNQSYQEWELLAVNDHSSDNSPEILKQFSKRDPRILLLQNAGNGIIPALRTAYSSATGQLVTRMDSDDIMMPNKLDHMVNDLKRRGKGHVALGLVRYFSTVGISQGYRKYEEWINHLTKKGTNYREIYKECVIPSPCWMVYKEDLDLCQAFIPGDYPEDYDLTFRFRKYGFKCIPCDELLHLWRDYPWRTSRTSAHYAQNSFLDMKVRYFLELDYKQDRSLTLWGAGDKGKKIAKTLLENRVDFQWLCDNPKKIGKKIYDKQLLSYQELESLQSPQSIISVANPQAQREIKAYLKGLGGEAATDYFFFC